MEVRPIAKDEVHRVASIHAAAFGEVGAASVAAAAKSLEEELARPWAHVRVAVSGEVLLGASVAWLVADEVHVLDVATDPLHRRRGVGRLLVGDLISLARAHRAVNLYLEVRRSNVAARGLYRGAGFAAVGVRRRYYADDEDAVEMTLALDAVTGEIVPRDDEVEVP
jgi:ribosomal-protein-alanine N-acetyltransferase